MQARTGLHRDPPHQHTVLHDRSALDHHVRTQDRAHHSATDAHARGDHRPVQLTPVPDPGRDAGRRGGQDRPVGVVEDIDPSREQVPVGLQVGGRSADITPVCSSTGGATGRRLPHLSNMPDATAEVRDRGAQIAPAS